jgi:hypothetical protein
LRVGKCDAASNESALFSFQACEKCCTKQSAKDGSSGNAKAKVTKLSAHATRELVDNIRHFETPAGCEFAVEEIVGRAQRLEWDRSSQ